MIKFEDFTKVDMRVGQIVRADPFPEARKPAYRLTDRFWIGNRPEEVVRPIDER